MIMIILRLIKQCFRPACALYLFLTSFFLFSAFVFLIGHYGFVISVLNKFYFLIFIATLYLFLYDKE